MSKSNLSLFSFLLSSSIFFSSACLCCSNSLNSLESLSFSNWSFLLISWTLAVSVLNVVNSCDNSEKMYFCENNSDRSGILVHLISYQPTFKTPRSMVWLKSSANEMIVEIILIFCVKYRRCWFASSCCWPSQWGWRKLRWRTKIWKQRRWKSSVIHFYKK